MANAPYAWTVENGVLRLAFNATQIEIVGRTDFSGFTKLTGNEWIFDGDVELCYAATSYYELLLAANLIRARMLRTKPKEVELRQQLAQKLLIITGRVDGQPRSQLEQEKERLQILLLNKEGGIGRVMETPYYPLRSHSVRDYGADND